MPEPPTEPQEQKYYAEGKQRRDPPTMIEDDRTIEAVHFYHGSGYEVGEDGVTEIVAYEEQGNGQHVMLPFIAVYKDGEIAKRIPAHCVGLASVVYRTEQDEQEKAEEFDAEDTDLPF